MAQARIKPGSAEWQRRLASLLTAEAAEPMGWWYLSFAKPGKFLGAAIVRERGFATAVHRAHLLGINPGGEVASWYLGEELPICVGPTFTHRLLSKSEAQNMGKPQ